MQRLAVLALAIALSGCAATHPVHPGAANTFDSNSYDAVLVAHSVIETTKTDLANNAFPASIAGQVKTALNDLIKAYDIADTSYQTYHTAALAGTATTAQSSAVSSALTDLQTKSAALTAAKASKPASKLIYDGMEQLADGSIMLKLHCPDDQVCTVNGGTIR